MKHAKKLVALGMATAMVFSSSMVAFASQETTAPATGEAAGSGGIEGFVDKNVFTVELPATVDVSFKLDPQELLLATNNAPKVDGSTATQGYGEDILFVDPANSGEYLTKSADISVVNMSTFDVAITVNAKVTGLASPEAVAPYDVKVVDDLSGEAATAITLALSSENNTITGSSEGSATPITTTALTADEAGITVTNTVEAIANIDDAYEISKATGDYKYQLKSNVSTVAFNEVTYNLSGKVNTEADWTNFNKSNAQLSVEVTYSVDKADASTISATNKTLTWDRATALTFEIDLGSFGKTSIEDVAIYYNSTIYGYNGSWGKTNLKDYNFVSVDGNKVTLNPGIASYLPTGATLFVRFNGYDSSVSKGDLQITVN